MKIHGTLLLGLLASSIAVARVQNQPNTQPSTPIPIDQLGAVAGKQYQGDGLSVTATSDGARLRCTFQRLEGLATEEGLWLSSTEDNATSERFRVMAVKVGRTTDFGFGDIFARQNVTGLVNMTNNVACFIRPGLTEEYSVSVDGVRQDFIIEQRPVGEGELRVELDVTGAKAEPHVHGARLVLESSGRKIAYSRLRVTDTRGQELTAHLEVTDATRMAVVVDDAAGIYPVRIDPTFSDADWISMGLLPNAVNQYVYATVTDELGNLYVGGDFIHLGDVSALRIAKWDGSRWAALGSGMNGTVHALAISGSNVYVGGTFTMAGGGGANRVATWDGNAWSALGGGMNNTVNALAVSGTNLYAGGMFTTAGSVGANRIAKWNGSVWSALGSGMSSNVSALVATGTDLYAGGDFIRAGVVVANRIAKWDGSAWSALGSGMNAPVTGLAVLGTNLYAGGAFTNAGGVLANLIGKWDGSVWSALGSGLGGGQGTPRVLALAVTGSELYAAGYFTTAGGQTAYNIAKWDGSAWSSLGTGVGATVSSLSASGSDVFAGGGFTSAGGAAARRIAKWNGSNWSALGLGLGMNNPILALAVSGTDVYVGGYFTSAGGIAANRIAKWNGNTWLPLGSGMNGWVLALAVLNSNVYAGGDFTLAGGVAVHRIAKWDGSSWSALGSGMNDRINALAISSTNLYAGGSFTNAGGVAADGIAMWNGNDWSALGSGIFGSGISSSVHALAASDTNLFVGGWFTNAGGVTANRIAKWNGSSWSALGLGISGGSYPYVFALASSGPIVYAGGDFINAGGVMANHIAKWDGTTWSALGSGMSGTVNALAVSGSDLYAGGSFTNADELTVSRIAKWDGISWSALGSGINGPVTALALFRTNLFAGGTFNRAGDKVSAYIAKANIGAARGRFGNLVYSPTTGFSWTFLDASIDQPYRIQSSPSLSPPSWTDFTNFIYNGPVVITVPSAGAASNRFFRAVTP